MTRAARWVTTAVFAATWAAVTVHATLTVPTDLVDVSTLAGTIVRGRVVDVRAFVGGAQGPVLTAVTMAVGETLKGAAGAFVTFRVHGGVMGRYESRVIGAPVFALHDDAYVFLKRAADGSWWPVGMSAGVYKIKGGIVAPAIVPGVTAPAAGPVVRGDARRRTLTTSEFAGLVRLLLAGTDPATGGPLRRPGVGPGRGGGGR